MQYGFYIDQTRCIGCHACVVSCKDRNDILPGPLALRKLYAEEQGTFPNSQVINTTMSCNHCAEPACIPACTFNAIYKDDKFTDEFLKQFRNECINMTDSDKETKKAIKSMLKLEDNPSIDAIKKYMIKYKKIFTDDAADMDSFLKNADDRIVELFTSTRDSILNAIQSGEEVLPKFYDKAKKCFNVPLDNSSNTDGLLAAIKAQQKVKGKAGLIWGATAGLVLGVGAYIVSKLSNNKQA